MLHTGTLSLCVSLYTYLCVFFAHFSPLSLPCQRRVGGPESRKSKRRIMETQVSASVFNSGEGGRRSGAQNLSGIFPFFQFFFMHPGKQLSAIQITCQSETVMKVHFAVEISLCLFTPSAAQCLIFFFSLSLYVESLLMLYSLLFA